MGGPDHEGFDVLVVTVSTEASRRWWTARLEGGRGEIARSDARISVVVEPRAAGNAGGTLLALQAAGEALGADLFAPSDRSVAVVHAAGKGTRLEPLTSAEGDKPRVCLPGTARVGGRDVPITLLEAVIRSTAPWGPATRGRVAVWWGDQLFSSPQRPTWVTDRPASLLVRPLPAADEAAWRALDLDRYGLVSLDGDVAQVEKVRRPTFVAAIGREPARVAQSLGVFAAEPALLRALAEVMAKEIEEGRRVGTDRGWWMPLTLSADGYAAAMAEAGRPEPEARAWHARLAPVRERFGPVLGATALDGPWWDFGTLAAWTRNVHRVVEDGAEAQALREVLGCERLPAGHPLDPDGGSVVVASRIGSGRLRRSVVVGCDLDEVDLHDAVRVGLSGPREAGGGLRYRGLATARP